MVWKLEDVPDVELLCHGVLAEVKPREPRTWTDEQDDLGYLFEKVVVIHGRYRPDLYPGILFRPWLYVQLRQRLQDKYRHEEGRHRDKPRPESLDAPAFSDGDAGADRLGRLVDGRSGSDSDDWAPACGGLLPLGDRRDHGGAGGNGDGADSFDRVGDPSAGPWRDCHVCGWRNYLEGPNGTPGWTPLEECGACGSTLGEAENPGSTKSLHQRHTPGAASPSGRPRSLAGNPRGAARSPEKEAA
jgi:hypothetical protein